MSQTRQVRKSVPPEAGSPYRLAPRKGRTFRPMLVQSGTTNAYTSVGVDVKGLARRIPRGVWVGLLAAGLLAVALTALPGAYAAVEDGGSRLERAGGPRVAQAA